MSSPEPGAPASLRAPTHQRRVRLVWGLCCAVLVIVAGGAVLIAGNEALDSGVVTAPEADTPLVGDYDLALLDQPGDVPVTMPKYLDLDSVGSGGLDPDSFRQLAVVGDATYLIGLSRSNELCMILELPGDISGTSCTTPGDFEVMALALRVQGPTNVAEGYLLPDRIADGGSNLMTIDPLLTATERHHLSAPGGYELQPLVPMDKKDREMFTGTV